eukprot:scaffold1786_cov398-Prasinococcus_capsulatus_cf.AAC.33
MVGDHRALGGHPGSRLGDPPRQLLSAARDPHTGCVYHGQVQLQVRAPSAVRAVEGLCARWCITVEEAWWLRYHVDTSCIPRYTQVSATLTAWILFLPMLMSLGR